MSDVIWMRAWPRDPTSGAEVEVRLAGGGAHTPYHMAGQHYRAGIVGRPRCSASLGFGKDGWTGGTSPTVAPIGFAPSDAALRDELLRLVWKRARVEIDVSDEGGAPTRLLTGAVADLTWSDGLFTLTVADMSEAYAKPMLSPSFAGTGGLDGHAGARGRPKRRSWGKVFNVEGQLLVPAHNIWEFGDPALPLAEIVAVRDKGREGPLTLVAWAGSAAATLSALQAAAAPAGGAAVAPSIACAKWWTIDPSGPITADLRGEVGTGYVDTVAAIASRLVVLAGGAPISNLATATGWRPGEAGLHVDDQSETWSAAIDRITLGASLLWAIDPDGSVRLAQWTFSGAAFALQASFIQRKETLPPTTRRTVTYRTNHRPHSDGEISAAILAADVAYADGTPIEDLKPAMADADVTAEAQIVVVPPPAQTIYRSWEGAPKAGQFPRTLTPGVTRGGNDIRTAAGVSYAIVTANVIASVSNVADATRGRISVTDGAAGSISLTVTVDGVAYGPFIIPFLVQNDPPPAPAGGGSGGGSDATLASVSSTGFAAMTRVDAGETIFTVTVAGAGDTIRGTAPLTYQYQHSSSGSRQLVARWEYRLKPGGIWTAFGSNITGSASEWFAGDLSGDQGSGTFNQTVTGLSAGDYEVRLVGALSASGGTINIETGTATVAVE